MSNIKNLKKRQYDEFVQDLPSYPHYVKLVADKNDLNWKQSAFVAWLTVPSSLREPKTMAEFADQIGVTPSTLSVWQHTPKHKVQSAIHAMRLNPYAINADAILSALFKTAAMRDPKNFQHQKLALQMLGIIDERGNPIKADDGQSENAGETLLMWKSRQSVNPKEARETLSMFAEMMADDNV